MLPLIIRLFTQSRRDDTFERLRSLSGLWPYEERAESRRSVEAAPEGLNFS